MEKNIISKISSISKVGLFASCMKNINAMEKKFVKFEYSSNPLDENSSTGYNENLFKILDNTKLTYDELMKALDHLDTFYFYNISNNNIILNNERKTRIKLANINIEKIKKVINDLSVDRQNEINEDLKSIKEKCFDYLYMNYFNKDNKSQPEDILTNIIKYHKEKNYTKDFKEKLDNNINNIVSNLYKKMSKYFKDEGIYRFINKFCYLYFNNIVDKISNNPENRIILPTIDMYDENTYSTKTSYETGQLLNEKNQSFYNLRKGFHKTDLDDDCLICCIKNLLTNSEKQMYKNILKWQTKNSFSDSSCYLKLYFNNLVKDEYKTKNRDLTNKFKEPINDIKENIEFLNLKYDKIIFTETIDFMWALTYVILTYGKIDTSNEINEKTNLYRVFYLPGNEINDTISKRDNLNDIFSSTSIGGPYYRFNGFSEDTYPVGYKVYAENFLCIYNYIFSFDMNSYMIDSELEIGYLFLDKLNLITLDDIEFPYDIKKEKIQDILSNIEKNYINEISKQNLYKNVFLTNAFCNINTFNNKMNNILKNELFKKNNIELNLDIKYFNLGKKRIYKKYTGNTFETLYLKEEQKKKMLKFLNERGYFKKKSNKISNYYDDIKEIYDFEKYKFEVGEFLGKKINYGEFLYIRDFNDYIDNVKKILSLNEILKKIENIELQNIKNEEDLYNNEFYKKIFKLKENNSLRSLNEDELEKLVESDNKFLFKKKLNIQKDNEINIEYLSKKYNLDEKQRYNLESYKKFLLNGFLEKYLKFIASNITSTSSLYYNLNSEIIYDNKFFDFQNLAFLDFNLYLFPSNIYQNFYDNYLNKSAEILYKRYLEKIKNFELENLQKYSKFEKNKKKDVLEILNAYLEGVNKKNKEFDIFNEYLGEKYLFKNLIEENSYKKYINSENKRKDDVKNFCDNILILEKQIIDDYKNELLLIGNIIDAFLNKEFDKLDVKSRIEKISNDKNYNDFLKSLINEEKGEKINKPYSFSDFINKLSKKIYFISNDLKTINKNRYENFNELEESCNEVNCEIEKINKKLEECNIKFYESTYFKNLLGKYSVKIDFLEKLYKEFLENEGRKIIYYKICISNKNIDKDLLDKILKKSETIENDNITDLKTLHNYIIKSLKEINLEGYKNFKKFTDFNKEINKITITSEKEETNLKKMEEEEEEDTSEQHEDDDDNDNDDSDRD